MVDDFGARSSFVGRLLSSPPRLRRRALLVLAIAAGVVTLSQLLPDGFVVGLLTAIAWIAAPFLALAIGYGDAFFIQYGRNRRRVLLTTLASVVVALISCAALTVLIEPPQSTLRDVLEGLLYAVLYLAVVLGLAGLIAYGIGLGTDYAARRIEELDDDDW